eukprot:jgi/Hompol1/1357/HPOL_004521-RA
MVSVTLLHRGVFYFTVMGTNMLPILKHGMDQYYSLYRGGTGVACSRPFMPFVCLDDVGSDWSIYTEVGADSLVAIMTILLVGLHSIISLYFFLFSCRGKGEDFIAGAEDGCCGMAAIVLSFGSYDNDVIARSKTAAAKWRRATRFVTACVQIAIIAALSGAIHVVSDPNSSPEQKSSLFVLLPCLMLNLTSWIENIYDGVMVLYGD